MPLGADLAKECSRMYFLIQLLLNFLIKTLSILLDVEKGEGIAFAQTYGVGVLPTLFITDANGKPITYAKGYIPADQLLKFGQFGQSKAPIK